MHLVAGGVAQGPHVFPVEAAGDEARAAAAAVTQAESAHRMRRALKLQLLQAQIEPHMLFNTLANLQGMILLVWRALRLKWKTNSNEGASRPFQSPGNPGPWSQTYQANRRQPWVRIQSSQPSQ